MPLIETSDVIKIINEQKEKKITSLISDYYKNINSNNTRFFYSSNNQYDDKLLPVLCSLFHDRNLTIEKILFEKNDFNNIDIINLRRIYHSINDVEIDHELEVERHNGKSSNSFLDKDELESYKKENVLDIYKEIFKDTNTSSYIKEFKSDIKNQPNSENFLILYNNNSNNFISNNFNSNINTNKPRKDIKLDWKDNSCYIDTSLVSIFHDGYETFENALKNVINKNKLPLFKIYDYLTSNNIINLEINNIISELINELLNIYKNIKEGYTDKFYISKLREILNNYNLEINKLSSTYSSFDRTLYKYDDTNDLLTQEGDVFQIINFILKKILNENQIKYFYSQVVSDDISNIPNIRNIPSNIKNYDKIVFKLSININNISTINITNIPLNLYHELFLSSIIIHKDQNHFISYIKYKDEWYEYNDTRNNDNGNRNYLKIINLNNDNIFEYIKNNIISNSQYKVTGIVYSRDNYKHLLETTNIDVKPSSIVCIDKDDDNKTVCLYKNNENWYKYDCQNYTSYEIKEDDKINEAYISNYKSPYYLIYK